MCQATLAERRRCLSFTALSCVCCQTHPVACVHPNGTPNMGEEVTLQQNTPTFAKLKSSPRIWQGFMEQSVLFIILMYNWNTVIHDSCSLAKSTSRALAGSIPSKRSWHGVCGPFKSTGSNCRVLCQIPSESVWRQLYANCILSALLHLNNKKRTSLTEGDSKGEGKKKKKQEPRCNLRVTFNRIMLPASFSERI